MTLKQKVRTRFAPSPTGSLHVGSLRTVLYTYLFARQNKGDFFLRIEDTDKSREVTGGTEAVINILNDLGIDYDEGPILKNGQITTKGEFGPYIQSQRLEIYQKYVQQLIAKGQAYYCFCTSERLEQMRQAQMANKQAPRYDGCCRNLTPEEVQGKLNKNTAHVIRMRVPQNKTIKFNDLIRGEIQFNSNDIDDQVLLKSDGFPTYHLAHVVDDHLMEVTHVIRAEEWLPSTPKHLLLFEYFGWETPQYAHLSILLSTDRKKLSKRMGDVAVEDYIKNGYLRDALFNFIVTIGWTEASGVEQEIYSMKELVEKFDITRTNQTGSIFNLEKLDWLNGQYIRAKKIQELTTLCLPYLKQVKADIEPKLAEKIVTIERERLKKLSDITQNINFLLNKEIHYDASLLVWKKSTPEQSRENLVKMEDFILNCQDSDFQNSKTLESKIIDWIKKNNYGVGDLLWPMRVALSGQQNSPGPFEIAWVLGKKETLRRLNQAQTKLK